MLIINVKRFQHVFLMSFPHGTGAGMPPDPVCGAAGDRRGRRKTPAAPGNFLFSVAVVASHVGDVQGEHVRGAEPSYAFVESQSVWAKCRVNTLLGN